MPDMTASDVMRAMGRKTFWTEGMGDLRDVGPAVKRVAGVAYVGMVALACVSAVVRSYKEDAVLRREFKEEWEAWAAKTRYGLVPYLF